MAAIDTYLGLRAFTDELVRCGVQWACTSPGSRSTPLVLTLARDKRINTTSHIDERCSAFFGLGVGKATQNPAALVCTSGTAAANFYPAIIEAFEGRVPLLVLTTDRPPELRARGAGQTIDQVKMYGDAVKWYLEVDEHDATPERMRWLRQLACRAYITATEGRPGPVHINFAFREPLLLDEPLANEEPGGGGRADGQPWIRFEQSNYSGVDRYDLTTSKSNTTSAGNSDINSISEGTRHETSVVLNLYSLLIRSARPVIVAGRQELSDDLGAAIAELANTLNIALLADPLSHSRAGRSAISHYDMILRDDRLSRRLQPDLVLRIGELPTSKVLRRWLASTKAQHHIFLDSQDSWQDPDSSVTNIISADVVGLIRSLISFHRDDKDLEKSVFLSTNAGVGNETPLTAYRNDHTVVGLSSSQICSSDVHETSNSVKAPSTETSRPSPPTILDITQEIDSYSKPLSLLDGESLAAQAEYRELWLETDRIARTVIDASFDRPPTSEGRITEPWLAKAVSDRLPDGVPVFVAASMPVRDIESFSSAKTRPLRVMANRGANGIDGTISTAYGVSASLKRPVVLLIGDVAAAHDIGGLLIGTQLEVNLVIILINNDGGGIFHFLPVAKEGHDFTKYIVTPHGLTFKNAAELYGHNYYHAKNTDTFLQKFHDALNGSSTTIIEVSTDREDNLALHKDLSQAVALRLATVTDS